MRAVSVQCRHLLLQVVERFRRGWQSVRYEDTLSHRRGGYDS
jgi:hypothetical protein